MTVVITGASRGIGKAIAEMFAAKDATLFLTSRNHEILQTTAKQLSQKYPLSTINAKAFDLSKKQEAVAFGNWVLSFSTSIDIVINNAGIFEPGNIYNEPDGLLESQLATNLLSAYHVTRTIVASMIKQKQGHIFNICSVASLQAYTNGGAYSISKFALDGFTKNLRKEMMPFNIKVTAVYPGAVMTDSWGNFDNSQQRIMEATDIAKMITAAVELSPAACVEEIIIRPVQGDL
jgi:short-subunit dehydrogenase